MEETQGRVSMPVMEWEKLTDRLDLLRHHVAGLGELVDQIDASVEGVAPEWHGRLRRLHRGLSAVAADLAFPF